jgi:hypothetical protein
MAVTWWDNPGGAPDLVPEELSREHWSEWDKATLGGKEIPGTVVIFAKKQKKPDVLTAAGQDFATINHLGVDPVEMDITITLWTPAQLQDYLRLVSFVSPKAFPPTPQAQQGFTAPTFAGPTSKAPYNLRRPAGQIDDSSSFEIRNPALNMLGVTTVYIYEIGVLVPGPVFGAKVTVWRAMEQRPPKPIQINVSTGSVLDVELINRGKAAPSQPTKKPSAAGIPP